MLGIASLLPLSEAQLITVSQHTLYPELYALEKVHIIHTESSYEKSLFSCPKPATDPGLSDSILVPRQP